MKIIHPSISCVILIALCLAGCGKKDKPVEEPPVATPKLAEGEVRFFDLEENPNDKLAYLKGSSEPFTGVAVDHHKNGQKSLEMNLEDGRGHGVLRRWDEKGQLTQRQFWDHGDLIENLTNEQARQAEAHFAERRELRATVWKKETQAQVYEDTFVGLWDNLRDAKDPYKVLLEFGHGDILLPALKNTAKLDWGIEMDTHAGGGTKVSRPDFVKKLEALRDEGYTIIETEWHQAEFDPEGPRSKYRFLIHAARATTRYIMRGAFTVDWPAFDENSEHYQPKTITVTEYQLLTREAPAAFNEVNLIDTALEFPQLKRAPEVHPILAYDLDRDGQLEIIVAGANRVYRRRGEQWFPDTLCHEPPKPMGTALLADFTGDGRADFLSTPIGRMPVLYTGGSKGEFVSKPREIPLDAPLKNAIACTAGDIDGDGDLDLWITQYRPPYQRGQMPTPYFDANDGWPAYLLQNDGKGNFTDITQQSGLDTKRLRRTYSTSFVDLDDDLDLDLVVINDFAGLDIYHNNGKGRFTDTTSELGEQRHSFGMSHALADFDRDNKIDLYMTGMGSTTARRLEQMKLGRAEFPEHQAKRMKLGYGNRMYLGGNTLSQPAWNDVVARSGWSWGCTAFDFDNDGDEDIYIANGHMSRKTAKDYCTKFWTVDIYNTSSKENPVMASVLNECLGEMQTISWNGFEHNVLFMNNHRQNPGQFVNVSWLMNLSHEYDSRSVLGEDLDQDGRPDILVSHIGWERQAGTKPYYLHHLQNRLETPNNWIGVQLHENGPGKSPIGARITIRHPGGTSVRQVVTGESWRSQHSNQKHFGLGTQKNVVSIEVRWPDGTFTRKENPKINQYHRIIPE